MTTAEVLFFIGAILVMLIGLIGSIVPVLPGLPIVWIAVLGYALLTDFESISRDFLIHSAIAVVIVMVVQNLMSIYGAKWLGASRWGTVGAFLGMVVGLITMSVVGLIIGPFIGAIAFELIAGKDFSQAMKAGTGTFIGFIFGTLAQLIASMVLMGMFIYKVVF